MSERIPSLDVVRPVINIGEENLAGLTDYLVDFAGGMDNAPVPEEIVRRILRPASALHATIIGHGELVRLYRRLGTDETGEVDKEHIEELSQYLYDVLPTFSKQLTDTPTLPSMVEPVGGHYSRGSVLSIAGSQEIVHERAFAKEAIRNFYRLETVPGDVWFDDERIVRVWLAHSSKSEATGLLRRLDMAVEYDDTLLPASTELGPVDIRKHF